VVGIIRAQGDEIRNAHSPAIEQPNPGVIVRNQGIPKQLPRNALDVFVGLLRMLIAMIGGRRLDSERYGNEEKASTNKLDSHHSPLLVSAKPG
jgi:hypothetical protein